MTELDFCELFSHPKMREMGQKEVKNRVFNLKKNLVIDFRKNFAGFFANFSDCRIFKSTIFPEQIDETA